MLKSFGFGISEGLLRRFLNVTEFTVRPRSIQQATRDDLTQGTEFMITRNGFRATVIASLAALIGACSGGSDSNNGSISVSLMARPVDGADARGIRIGRAADVEEHQNRRHGDDH